MLLSRVSWRRLLRCWPVHVAVCWGLVLLTFVPGVGYEPPGTGSQSWIALPLGMSFQPTELAKLSFVLSFAAHLEHVGHEVNRPKALLPLLAHLLAPPVLVHFQGDDGTAFIFLAIGVIMLVAAGLNRWTVAGCTAAALAAAPFAWRHLLSVYQRQRILGLFDPAPYADTIMYQQLCGRAAIRSGGLFGRGLFQPQHTAVPRPENDFIFSYFAESWGFVGCLLLLGLLFGLMLRFLRVASAAPGAGFFICIGGFAMLLVQTVVNVGMNLMLAPVVGITLPFVSAGGTSVAVLYLAVGLVVGVARQAQKAGQPGIQTSNEP
ncbi:MAG: FtsW/RodA/SpoVE family cell cycle protein [Oscillospiraceae bacterium]